MPTISRTLALAGALSLAPAAAYAVNVSANDGNGEQVREVSYNNGAAVKGWLRSTSGDRVYYSGKVALGTWCPDVDTGRYSANTRSSSYVPRGGTISTILSLHCGVQGVKSRVCTVKDNRPDVCGSDSATY